MNKFTQYALARLREPSTWYGAMNLLTAFGVLHLNDAQSSAVSVAVSGLLAVGTAAIMTPDKQV